MTRVEALEKLLVHGALTWSEIREITGWKKKSVDNCIQRLCRLEVIRRVSHRPRYAYALASLSTTSGLQPGIVSMQSGATEEAGRLCRG